MNKLFDINKNLESKPKIKEAKTIQLKMILVKL